MSVITTGPRWVLALVLTASTSTLVQAATKEAVTMAPVLVSTEGGGPRWETVEQLAAAAKEGDPVACFQYAQLLENGDQVEANPDLALTYYRKAAVQDHPDAVFRLGKIAHDGLLGQPQNFVRALDLYRKAATLGVPEGTYNVGAMNVSGRGTKRNYVEGLAWLLLAAEQGSDPNDSVAAVKKRLKSRPDYITRAANRLAGLKAELAAAANPAPAAKPKAIAPDAPLPAVAPPVKPTPINIAPARPSFSPRAPTIGVPSISIPPPTPKPVPPPSEP